MMHEWEEDVPQPLLDRAMSGKNTLIGNAAKYMFGGPEISEQANNGRLQKFIEGIRRQDVTAKDIVAQIHAALNPQNLPLRSCSATHEGGGFFCAAHLQFGGNIGCLHAGEEPLHVTNEFLHAWKLLPRLAADYHRKSIRRSRDSAIIHNQNLDNIAARLWGRGQNPSANPGWQKRFQEVGNFREVIREALLRVVPNPSYLNQIAYVRDALLILMRRPSLITAEEKERMLV